MKKNIFSVIITALTVINVVLTAILFFVMVPTFQKTNTLITHVASVLNLDLDADGAANADENYTLADCEDVEVTFDETQTLNLKPGSDNSQHYAMIDGYVLQLNTKSDDYDKYSEVIAQHQNSITDIIRSVIQNYTNEDISEDAIKKDALEEIQEYLNSKVVVSVSYKGFVHQ